MPETFSGLEVQSRVTTAGELELGLAERTSPALASDEVLIEVEAAPINPSDIAVLIGPADIERMQPGGTPERPTISAPIPRAALASLKARLDQPVTPGNEGAGTVVAAGRACTALLGRRVAIRGGGLYAQYRVARGKDCTILPEGVSAADGASIFVNPLTALCFIESMKAEGHSGLVHFAAASSLGKMLNRICLQDGIPLVNVVRTEAQLALLRDDGAQHVLNSTSPDFEDQMMEALAATGATLAFDPISGGRQAAQVLSAMEKVANRHAPTFDVYGSGVFKQVYIYGGLDRSPIVLDRWLAFAWGIGGWLLTYRLRQIGPEAVARLQARVLDELKTTFATGYTASLSLAEMLIPGNIEAYSRRGTGEKFLVTPRKV